MRYLRAIARNIWHSLVPGKDGHPIQTTLELGVTLTERTSVLVGTDLARTDDVTTVRFVVLPDDARQIANDLITWADDADRQAEALTLDPAVDLDEDE